MIDGPVCPRKAYWSPTWILTAIMLLGMVSGKAMAMTGSENSPVTGEVGYRTLPGPPPQPYYLYLPRAADGGGRVLVLVHGISRNAEEIITAFSAYAERYKVVLVAPLFDEKHFSDFQRLGRKGRGERADLALRRILDDVEKLARAPTKTFYFYGNSGGGQFVHRYAMAYPDQVIRYAISGTGWYSAPDLSRRFPHGFKATKALPGVHFDLEGFLRVPACVLVGEEDTERDRSLNQSARIEQMQGRTRVERAKWWVSAVTTAARWRGFDTEFALQILSGAGHDFTEMEEEAHLGEAVFQCLFTEP